MSATLVFETRAKCQDFVARYKDDGIPYEIDSPFCSVKTTITVRQSKSLEDREIGKQFASLWRVLAEQLKILFLERDDEVAFIVPALDARSQVLSIKDRRNGIGKSVFKLAPFGSGQLFTLVAPDLCVPGFPVMCCNGSSLKPARPLCDGRPFASPHIRRLAGRGAIFYSFPCRWVLHFALSLIRCQTVQDATSCPMENSLFECGCPYNDLSCLFFTALLLQRSQSILVQENQPVKDIDLTCFKTFPINTTTCAQVGPMSLNLPLDPIARFDHSRPSSTEGPNDEQQRGDLPASTRSRWRQDALQPPQILQGIAGRDTCGPFPDGGLRCINWNTRGLVGSVFFQTEEQRVQTFLSQEAL